MPSMNVLAKDKGFLVPTDHNNEVSDDIAELIQRRIETLRPKLLDFSARNPLIQTRFSERGSAHVRVVDELPDVLFHNLNSGTSMRFLPLPDLDVDPADEATDKFKSAVAIARRSDDAYAEELSKLDTDEDDYLSKSYASERKMKDRVRDQLKMPKRQTKSDVNIKTHARNNNISPSFDLPLPEEETQEERHIDTDIQTLTLPRNLERRFNSIISKDNSFAQETGINVLHGAFGFLEWNDPKSSKKILSPLILMPIRLETKKTAKGIETWVKNSGEDPKLNEVLCEKFRLEFGVELPEYEGGSIEDYLKKLGDQESGVLKWQPKRYIAFGIFPSSRMAMYFDLDTTDHEFSSNSIISGLFAGNPIQSTLAFAEDHDVDSAENEIKIPYLVKEADASQLSTLIDIADGKNLAVEGPPGTGKSQTIVNAIAAALANGKKVIFVAEKSAALEVVQSRMEAVGLGDFALPLIAGRSTRDAVLRSIRSRMNMQVKPALEDYETELAQYKKVRDQLSKYSQILSSKCNKSGLTVHEVLGNSIATAKLMEKLPDRIRYVQNIPAGQYDKQTMDELLVIANSYVSSWKQLDKSDSFWKGTTARNLVKFQIEAISRNTIATAEQFEKLSEALANLEDVGINHLTNDSDILNILELAIECLKDMDNEATEFKLSVFNFNEPEQILKFSEKCKKAQYLNKNLAEIWKNPHEPNLLEQMQSLEELVHKANFKDISFGKVVSLHAEKQNFAELQAKQWKAFQTFAIKVKTENFLKAEDIKKAKTLIANTGHSVLEYRSSSPPQQGYVEFLQQACIRGRELQSKRSQIETIFVGGITLKPSELLTDIATFKTAGTFRALSGEFRKAKKRYISIARETDFEISKAVNNLQTLMEYTKNLTDYKNDPKMLKLMGLHFNGIDTNFDKFEALVDYYNEIERLFPSTDHVNFRAYLATAPTNELFNMPSLDEELNDYTSTTLQQYLTKSLAALNKMAQFSKDIEPYIGLMKSPETLIGNTLKDNIEQLKELKALILDTDDDTKAKELLKDNFDGWKTKVNLFHKIAEKSHNLEKFESVGAIVKSIYKSGNQDFILGQISQLKQTKETALNSLEKLCTESGLSFNDLINSEPPKIFAEKLRIASFESTQLSNYSQLSDRKHLLDEAGFGWVLDELQDDKSKEQLSEIIQAIIWRVLSQDIYKQHGADLAKYTGSNLNDLRSRLIELDKQILASTQNHLRAKLLSQAKPPYGVGIGRKSEYTEMALLEHQIQLKRPNAALRKLTRKAGNALLELKPCWMMSPLAVAQYLERDSLKFDLCIIDEASQMPPEDAIGALVRSKQAVIVGDTNQLPPSNFFKKIMDDDDADEDDVTIEESVLEMANSTFRPKRRLRWHYRSRHSGLIKLSNRLVYDDELIVFPSPDETRKDMGVFLEHVKGNYKSGLNPIEAETIANAAIEFMLNNPNRSLGIVALNKIQTEQIDALIYEATTNNIAVQKYRDYWEERENGIERFFVKNLENVQGDERDVIFISTVYGPTEAGGKTAQRFGPITGLAGKRRLNVLFSRAKEQITTFSSMTASDILADPISNPGANMLKQWLEYSATGNLDGGIVDNTREPDSDFERHVISVINGFGLKAVPQVGVSGYFIDIGVIHPDWPHGFLMGIECDGASYHSSRSARDRDRLRQEVLEGLGWHFHRIWSTDWFNDVYGETMRLRKVIEARLAAAKVQKSSNSSFKNHEHNEFSTKPTTLKSDSQDSLEENAAEISSTQFDLSIEKMISANEPTQSNNQSINIGDTVRVRLISDKDKILEFKISDHIDDIENGILHFKKPLAVAVLDKEDGDEFEYLVGSYVKQGTIEQVKKSAP